MSEVLETKAQAIELIREKAAEAAEKYIKDHGADYTKSAEGQKEIKEMIAKSFEDFEVTHGDVKVKMSDYVKSMQASFDQMAVKMSEEKGRKNKSFDEQLGDMLKEKGVELSSLQNGEDTKKVSFNIKAAGTMLLSTNYTGGVYALTSWDPEFARVPRRQPFMRQLVSVRPVTGMYIAWAEQANLDGDAAWTAEGALKSQIDFDVVERTTKVKKLTDYIKISREMLSDFPWMNGEIRQELIEKLNLKFDQGILSGSGTGEEILGILNHAIGTFAVPTGFTTVPAPNNYDVILAAVTQIVINSNGAYQPNYVIMNPVDTANLQMVRNAEGTYILPPFSTANGVNIAGVQVVANVGVAAGTFLVGDFSRDTLAMREEINISVGYENDDFTRNLVTVLAELRAANYIKTNHLTAFVKGSFATAKTALTAA